MKEYRVLKMYSEFLKKDKRLFIYLPKDYDLSDEFYPVLYMHDGQNLFDDAISYAGKSWGIMEAYEEHPDLPKLIIVGIESDEERSDELIPVPFEYFETKEVAGGKADLYLNFITKELKPYIDKTYRTLKSPKHTGLMGSSFGGVNTLYAALAYENYFSRFGIISNAYLFDGFKNKMDDLLEKKRFTSVRKLWLDVGTNEHESVEFKTAYLDNNKELAEILYKKLSKEQFHFKIIEGGIHHESEWAKRFSEILYYLFNN